MLADKNLSRLYPNIVESTYLGVLKGLSNVKKPEFLKNHIKVIIKQVLTIKWLTKEHSHVRIYREDFFTTVINKGSGTHLYELIQDKLNKRDFEFFTFVLDLSRSKNFYSFRERMMRESILKSAYQEFLCFIVQYYKKFIKENDLKSIGPKFEQKDFITYWLNLFYQLVKRNQYYTSQDKPLQKMQELNLFMSYNFIIAKEQC